MIIRTCDACRRRIPDDEAGAARNLPLGDNGELVDWCATCVEVVRRELPNLAAEAKRARVAAIAQGLAEPVQQRAMNLWPAGFLRAGDHIKLHAEGGLPHRNRKTDADV